MQRLGAKAGEISKNSSSSKTFVMMSMEKGVRGRKRKKGNKIKQQIHKEKKKIKKKKIKKKKKLKKKKKKKLTLNVVRNVRVRRNKRVQGRDLPSGRVRGVPHRGLVLVGKRKVIKEVTETSEGFDIVVEGQVGDSTLFGVSQSTTKNLSGNVWKKMGQFDELTVFFFFFLKKKKKT